MTGYKIQHNISFDVEIRNGQLVGPDGSPLPKFKNGTKATFIVPSDSIDTSPEITKKAFFLPKGTNLRMSMYRKAADHTATVKWKEQCKLKSNDHMYYVDIELNDDLYIELNLSKKSTLCSCPITVPKLAELSPKSLNQAYTMISQAVETWRASNTGNVFDRFFYLPQNSKTWAPLKDLREEMLAKFENDQARQASN